MKDKCYAVKRTVGSRLKKKLPLLSDAIIKHRNYKSEKGNYSTLEIRVNDLFDVYEYLEGK